MKLKYLAFLLAAALLVVLAACSGQSAGPTVVHVTLSEFKVETDKSSVPAGPITFEISNAGAIEHEFVVEPAGAHDEPFEANGVESEVEDIEAGATGSLEWTLEPGEYQLACYVEGHFEAGMFTPFTVK